MKTRFFLLVCIVLLLAGCATTEVVDTWKDDSQVQKFTNVYVLGIIKEPVSRNMHSFAAILPGKKAFRYMQVENKLEAIARHELAKEIPLAR